MKVVLNKNKTEVSIVLPFIAKGKQTKSGRNISYASSSKMFVVDGKKLAVRVAIYADNRSIEQKKTELAAAYARKEAKLRAEIRADLLSEVR